MGGRPHFAVTVVVPLYNKARFIRATLQAVLDQSLPAAEIIVVDDQSSDGGPAIVRAMGDSRIRLIAQPNAGPGPARNRGVAEARTAWVAFLDGDDLWRPGHLAALARLADCFPSARALATGFERCAPGTQPAPLDAEAGPHDRLVNYFAEAQAGDLMWTSCVAMDRDAFEASGGFGAFQPGEDFEYWARFALDYPIAVTSERTALYMLDPDGLMHRAQRARPAPFALQPIFATLQEALDDPRRNAQHAAIAAYRDSLLTLFMRHALYRANGSEARHYARLIRAGGGSIAPAMQLLSMMPDSMLRTGMAARRAIRRSTEEQAR